jgi:5-formyltetrahydrofolate cyclo-ligase
MKVIKAQKAELRTIFSKKRSALNSSEINKLSLQINQNFITHLLPKIYNRNSDKIFALYLPSAKEVNTQLIAKYFQENQVVFCYPKITKKDSHLDFILAEESQILVPNQFYPKILEPVAGKKIFPDYLILPLLAFDDKMSRLGRGGGFFDRTISFLKKQKPQIITIGLAYDFQRSNKIVTDKTTDQKLDFIVTEHMIFSAN